MKKGFAVLLVGMLALSNAVFAKTDSLDQWAQAIKAKYNGTTINVAFASHPSTEAFQKMTPEFEKLTGIKVKWDVMEETYLKNKQLMDYTGNSHLYDVLMVDGFWMSEYAPKKVIAPLKSFINSKTTPGWFDYKDIVPAYSSGIGTYQGQIYGIPTAGETRFVGYRKDLFAKYGKRPPKTMDEMLELAKFFNGKEPGLYGIAMRAQRGIHFASGWMTVMYNFGGGFVNQKTWKVTMTDPRTVQSLKYFVALERNAPPDVASYTHEEAVSAFMAGKTAMWFDATALVPWITDPKKSTIYDKVGFVAPPKGPAGDAGVLAGWNVAIASNSRNKEAAWAFITYMTSKLKAKEYVQNGGVPTRTSVYSDKELVAKDPSYPVQLQALSCASALVKKGIAWLPPTSKLDKILDRAGYYGNLALTGEITPEDACKKAQVEIEDIMSE